MENPIAYDISERPQYKFKKHPFVLLEDDPLGTFSQVLSNVLHVEDVGAYIHYKFEIIGDNEIHKELNVV